MNLLLSHALVFPSECLCPHCMKDWAVMAHAQRMTLSAQRFSFSSLTSSLSILPSQSFTAEALSLHSLGGMQQSLVRERETDLFLESYLKSRQSQHHGCTVINSQCVRKNFQKSLCFVMLWYPSQKWSCEHHLSKSVEACRIVPSHYSFTIVPVTVG